MEIKTHDDFKNIVTKIMGYIYDTIPPCNPCMVAICYADDNIVWPAYNHTKCITKEFGMLIIADHLLGLNYNFGDLDLSNIKKIFDKQLDSLFEKMKDINNISGLRYVVRTVIDKQSFAVISNLDERDNIAFLDVFKNEIKKTGG